MEQQLQSQIKKNKNLLQSNFKLMQQNEQCISALTHLKKFILESDGRDDCEQQTVSADDADSLVTWVIDRISQERQDKKLQKTEQKKQNQKVHKQCECEKWKDLYIKQSEESYRLSKKVTELQQNINKIESKHDLESKEMDNILKQYLILFKKINSVQFLQAQSQQLSSKKVKQSAKEMKTQNNKTSRQKQKRSVSKNKNQHSKSQSKKSVKLANQADKSTLNQNIQQNVIEQLNDFPNFLSYLQSLRKDYENFVLQNKILREQISDNQTLIRIYRLKQRQRILYSQFLVQ